MKNFIFYTGCFIAIPLLIHSQEIKIVEEGTKRPIPFADIEILNAHQIYHLKTNLSGTCPLPDLSGDKSDIILKVFSYGFYLYKDTLKSIKGDIEISLKKWTNSLDEIVITGEPVPTQKENSIYQVRIINESKINSIASQNLREILTNEPNIRLQQDNILGSSLSINGLSGQAVKIMIDGIPVIGRLDGNIDISQLNTYNIEKIEIIEGPMAVKYGTDAMGGVINIITKTKSHNKLSLKTTGYYESNGTYNFSTTNLIKFNKHTFNISIGRNFFDGWNIYEKPFEVEKTKIADTLRYKLWKPKEQYFATLSDNILLKKTKMLLYSDVFYELIDDKGKPRSPYYETAIDNTYKTWRDNQKVTLNFNFNKNKNIDLIIGRANYKRIKNTYFNDLTTLQKELTTNNGDQDTSTYQLYMSRLNYTGILFSTPYEIGYDIYTESAYSTIIKNRIRQQYDLALFTSYNIQLKNKKINIKPAVRLTYNSLYQTPVIPSLHLKYLLYSKESNRKHQSFNIRASYSRGFRSPSLKELFLNFIDINHNIIGNTHLKPELSNFYNLSFTFINKSPRLELETNISAFYNNVFNLIQLAVINQNTNQYSYINIDKLNTTGINFNTKYNHKNIQTTIVYTYIGRNYPTINPSKYLFSNEVVFNISYNIKKYKSSINFYSKYNGRLPYFKLTASNDKQNSYTQSHIPDYIQMDFNYSQMLLKNKLQASIGVKNIFNVSYLNISGTGTHSSSQMYISTGRTYFIQIILNLNK